MKVKTIIIRLIIIFSLSSSVLAQNYNGCDTIRNEYLKRHTGYEHTLVEFIRNRVIKDSSKFWFISDRNKLEELLTYTCTAEEVFLVNKTEALSIEIKKGLVSNKQPNLAIIDTLVESISSIIIFSGRDKINIPKAAYSDLYFPNFQDTNLPIQPIKAYLSPKGTHIYIYIFGKELSGVFPRSYMAKLIIDKEKGYIDRAIVSGRILSYYKWDLCFDEFIGF